jgi:isocitrate/isopropylmalate dehydrogenase
LRAAGADYEFQEYDVNADQFLRTGEPIPHTTWKEVAKADAILFGAVGDPRVNDATYLAGVLLRLRFELDLYVNLRPAKLYDDRLSSSARTRRAFTSAWAGASRRVPTRRSRSRKTSTPILA